MIVTESSQKNNSIYYYRITYNGNGIYEELKKELGYRWKYVRSSDVCNWLPRPPEYKENYKSYFTKIGYRMFKVRSLEFCKKVLDPSKIKIEKVKSEDIKGQIIYYDEYQIVIKFEEESKDDDKISTFENTKKIYESLTDQEKKFVCPSGRFVDSPYLIYRKVEKGILGFIEAYNFNGTSKNTAFVTLAVREEGRGKGLGKKLLINCALELKKNGYKKLMYRLDKENVNSEYLIKSIKESYLSSETKTSKTYFIDLDKFEPDLKKYKIIKEDIEAEGMDMKLYHVSENDLDGKILSPRIPSNYFTKNGYEDNKTPRVIFSKSIQGCLMGLSKNIKDRTFYVYVPEENIDENDIHIPTVEEVPDADIVGEVWVLKPVKLKKICRIHVKNVVGNGIPFEYGKGSDKFRAELYTWSYEIEETDAKYEKYILDVNKIRPYIKTILEAYKKEYDFDLSYIKFVLDIQPHYTDGRICTDHNITSETSGGCWTELGIIYLNPEMYRVLLHYNTNLKINDKIFHGYVFHIISHELAHEIYKNLASDEFKDNIIKEAIDSDFSTNYLNHVSEDKKKEEMFCEYLPHKLADKYLIKVDSIYS